MKEKKLLVMTSFGPVPFDAVKGHLPKEVAEAAEAAANEAFTVLNPENVEYYINKIAMEKHWDYKKVASYLDNLEKFSPVAAFSVLLREVAIHLDSQYEDSIDKAEEIYVISTLDGKIHKAEEGTIKNFRNFAAFRTVEDARFAHRVLSKKIRKMFRGCGE